MRAIPKLRRSMPLVLLLCLLLCLSMGTVLAQAIANPVTEPENILLSLAAEDSVTVSWWQQPHSAVAYLRYGNEPDLSDHTQVAAQLQRDGGDYLVYAATISGLDADTDCYYQVGDGEQWSDISCYRPADSNGGFSFLYFGDVQFLTYGDSMASQYQDMQELISLAREQRGAAFALQCGDLVNTWNSDEEWQVMLNALSAGLDGLPLMTANGNHECNPVSGRPELYRQMFSLPQNGPADFSEEFYSFDYGDVHFTVLNTNLLSGEGDVSEQQLAQVKDWIDQDLAASEATWKIVLTHHPAYSVVADPVSAQVLTEWSPLFAAAQVDLVLCGHQHVYMRSKSINGVTYVMSVSGHKLYTAGSGDFIEVQIDDTTTFQTVDVSDQGLELVCYDAAGEELDRVTLTPKNRTVPRPDINADDTVDQADVEWLLEAICERRTSATMDINEDGTVDVLDAQALALSLEQGGAQ